MRTAMHGTLLGGGVAEPYEYQLGGSPTVVSVSVLDGLPLRGMFKDADETAELQTEVGVATLAPRLGVRLADLGLPPRKDDRFHVRGSWYVVVDVEPDGEGMATIVGRESEEQA